MPRNGNGLHSVRARRRHIRRLLATDKAAASGTTATALACPTTATAGRIATRTGNTTAAD